MNGPLLYSTNVFLKQFIQKQYRGDVHYVWCSEVFDSRASSWYSPTYLVPPSSNPADIYRELKRDVDNADHHSEKIAAQKASFKALAVDWESKGEITDIIRSEIITLVDSVSFLYWRPLIYIIPRDKVNSRLTLVPAHKRAGVGAEFIISDLKSDEFDIIEL